MFYPFPSYTTDQSSMETKIVALDDYVPKTETLLELERAAELKVIEDTLTSLSLPELVLSGTALSKLHIVNVRTGMGHRKLIKFVKKVQEPYPSLPSHKFGSGEHLALVAGDTVGVSYSNNYREFLSEGVIVKTTEVSVTVAVDVWDKENIDIDRRTFCILPTANDVTYKRLKSCLEFFKDYTTAIGYGLVEYLFGKRIIPAPLIDKRLENVTYFDTSLNSTQQGAVKMGMNNTRPVFIIHGPPGTGKTRTVVEIIRQAAKIGQKVLVCAPSNVAVDNIIERIGQYVRLVRIGHPARSHPTCAQYTLDAKLMNSDHSQIIKDIRNEMDSCIKSSKWRDLKELRNELSQREKQASKQLLQAADVVCSTLTSASVNGPLRAVKERGFDLVIIDECAQSVELACWIALLQGKRCILAGDHKQLPPTVISEEAAQQGFSRSLMERIANEFGGYSCGLSTMLDVQYRMNDSIMQWASKQMYDGKLVADDTVKNHCLRDIVPGVDDCSGAVLRFIDTDGCDMQEIITNNSDSKGNIGEVKLVYVLVKGLVDAGCDQKYISIISPYNLQVNLLRQYVGSLYPLVTIRSVDGFQGQENEIMLLSLVRSSDKGEVGFLKDSRRINVAVTRARRQLVVVGDSSTVNRDVFIKSLVEHIEQHGCVNHANEFNDFLTEVPFEIDTSEFLVPVAAGDETGKGKQPKHDPERKAQNRHKGKGQKPASAGVIQSETRNPKQQPTGVRLLNENDVDTDGGISREDLEMIIDGFFGSELDRMELDACLNSYERMLVHEMAEALGLGHDSIGEGNDRRIVLVKLAKEPIESETGNTNQDQILSVVVGSDKKLEGSKGAGKQNNEKKPKSKKKKQKCREDALEKQLKQSNIDDDALLEMMVAERNTCAHDKCKTSVAVLGQVCKHCKGTFCFHHSMPEVHGCGHAAKAAAKKEYMTVVAGVLMPQKTPKYNERQKLLQDKLDKKVQDMQNERTGKKK